MKKVILVTGSSRGIGAGLVQRFAGKGEKVVINFNKSSEEAFRLRDALIKEIPNENILALKADVSSRDEVIRMFDEINSSFGQVDILINNAGLNIDRPFLQMKQDEWSRVQDIILTGSFNCSQEFAFRYKGSDGHIINIGALTAIRGRKNGANYCSARAGVVNLTKCLALELAPSIKVNTITPGYIKTEELMERYQLNDPVKLEAALNNVPMERLGTTDDIFNAAAFIVYNSSYLTGQNIIIDGGNLMY